MYEAHTIEYELGQDNVQVLGFDIHNPVFAISAGLIVAFVAFTLLFPESAESFFGALRPWLTSTFDWLFMGAANLFVVFCLFLVVSPLGRVRLGGPDARPDYGYAGWFAMLFAAGMGIGLMFFGVLEPVYHFQHPPLGIDGADTEAARAVGMAATIFHWG
ncbi:MAG: BCCT family transporter, partial [Rhodocyclaceae bacterium]|nr:BCCT family transporter [Rhodocyclaceae bacterium]